MSGIRDMDEDRASLMFTNRPTLLADISEYWMDQFETIEAELNKYHKLHDEAYNEMRILTEQYEKAKASVFAYGAKCDKLERDLQESDDRFRIAFANNVRYISENKILTDGLKELRKMEFDQYGHSTYVSEFIDHTLSKLGWR